MFYSASALGDYSVNESSPDDLRKWNEQTLSELGANGDLIAQFLTHPWYSPRQETIITAALKKTQVDPSLSGDGEQSTDGPGRKILPMRRPIARSLLAKSRAIAIPPPFRTDFFVRSTATGCSLFRRKRPRWAACDRTD